MTGPEHYRRAEEFMAAVTQETHYGTAVIANPDMAVIAAAQVHATLALAAVAAVSILSGGKDMPIRDGEAWLAVAAIPRDTPLGGAA